jgi:simple sugar transport system permease protein
MKREMKFHKFNFKKFMGRLHLENQTLLLIAILIVLVGFFRINEDGFLTQRSITSMGFQLPEIGVLSLAMMLSIMTGGINLSINATSNLGAVLAGLFMVRMIPEGLSGNAVLPYLLAALLIMLIIGILSGVINGYLIGHIGVPPILATLGTSTLFTGISTGLTGGKTVTGFPEQLEFIGAETFLGIPIPYIIFLILTIVVYVILNHTIFGFKIRMLGSNPTASNFSGINNESVIMRTYILSGLLASIAGVIVMGRTMSAAYEYGSKSYVLLTILIAVLAGIQPGFGNVLDIFLGVTILQVLSTGFHMLLLGLRGSSFFKDFSWGILLIIIFIINFYAKKRKTNN